ncbi:Por secretion system C-terminal sorting domain-containing protein [Maribacter orientalis]|uniref:Por secretion system C-terminal sorting domain-containing protein n=1 Tax=Maribacter orientalis TaxID=228957 RepID=A0A1H7U3Z1_9FLAO|nr:BspA family leucine-rich repeat surface protein [Maribacter orientalis]SEL91780.1 Por secretion system C-terminal sorting domain-containing protein [Maribacter orientalis]
MRYILSFLLFLLVNTTYSQNAFISTWKTDNPGVSEDNQIRIPTFPGETYNYTVDWGDGTSNNNVTGNITHTYVTPGTYQISIIGDFPRIYFNYFPDDEERDYEKLVSIDQWGEVKWSSMSNAFARCSNMDVKAIDIPDLSLINNMSHMFAGCINLVGNDSFNNWDVAGVTNMSTMFLITSSFNQPISGWDVGKVMDMSVMFAGATSFNQDIGTWDVSSVSSMGLMFSNAISFNQDLGNWDVTIVDDMKGMFRGSGLSNDNYDNILVDWSQLPSLQNGVTLDANQNQYCLSAESRQKIITNYEWVINDAGENCLDDNLLPKLINFSPANEASEVGLTHNITLSFDQEVNVVREGSFVFAATGGSNSRGFGFSPIETVISNENGTVILNPPADLNPNTEYIVRIDPGIFVNEEGIVFPGLNDANVWRFSTIKTEDKQAPNLIGLSPANESVDVSVDAVYKLTFDEPIKLGASGNVIIFTDNPYSSPEIVAFVSRNNIKVIDNVVEIDPEITLDPLTSYRIQLNEGFIEDLVGNDFVPNPNFLNITTEALPFITTWKTDNPGVSEGNQITIPTFSGETYDFTVDWGDGTSDTNINGDITHTYEVPGTYQVSIAGTFPRIYFYGNHNPGSNDVLKILSVNQWGTITWTSFESAFEGCSNLDVLAQDIPNLSLVSSLKLMFDGCANLVGNSSINNWDVSNVSNMDGVFANALIFNQNINGWDTSRVTTTSGMFFKARSFSQPLNSWNVTNVEDMSFMFGSADEFNQPLDLWNTTSTKNMNGMFEYAIEFNQPLDSWNVSNVENMQSMFLGARSFNHPLNSWNVSNVTNMYGMFQEAGVFNQPLNSWNIKSVNNLSSMFWNATSFNQNIADWNVSNVTYMNSTFKNAMSFNQDLSNWNIVNVSSMYEMFSATSGTTEIYDKTLIGWSNLPTLQNNVVFDGGNSQYCESEEARQYLIDTYGWTITDGGKDALCNQDNDLDGILDHKDNCLSTVPNATVNENGCEIIPNNAILVYGLTPTCPGQSNGSIQVTSTLANHSFSIIVDGPSASTNYNISLSEPFSIDNLTAGAYTVEISIPEVNHTQTFGIQINEVGSIRGKRENLDLNSKSVSYVVEGSHSYKVNINGLVTTFDFDSTGTNQIELNGLKGFNEISITGESDCQGMVTDSFAFSDGIIMYPTITTGEVFVEGFDESSTVLVYDLAGRLVLSQILSGKGSNSIDLRALENGMYPTVIQSKENSKAFKIIKQ